MSPVFSFSPEAEHRSARAGTLSVTAVGPGIKEFNFRLEEKRMTHHHGGKNTTAVSVIKSDKN